MDVPEPAEAIPEPISIARCRELLGDEADALADDDVLEIARHAEAMAHMLIVLALQDVAFTDCHAATTDLADGAGRD